MNIKELETVTGGLSKPSKMPGLAYGTPASACGIGSILRAAGKHTVCGSCYAHKGMYSFPVVKAAQARRLESISDARWASWMTELIGKKLRKATGPDRVFRWHDSGDIRDAEHLSKIAAIAKNLPTVNFWLPTKEYKIVRNWLDQNKRPKNLTIRVSGAIIGAVTPAIPGTVSSTVASGTGYACPAYTQGGKCGDCRACWNNSVKNIDYSKH